MNCRPFSLDWAADRSGSASPLLTARGRGPPVILEYSGRGPGYIYSYTQHTTGYNVFFMEHFSC